MAGAIRTGWHWEFGWLRRPESDEVFGYCYEEPDGDLVYFGDPIAKDRVLLDVMADEKTGEHYLCMSKKPPLSVGKKARASK